MNDEPAHLPPSVRRLQAHSAEIGFAMACDNRTGALLRTLAASKPGGHIVELGTGTGVGAAWLLRSQPTWPDEHQPRVDTFLSEIHQHSQLQVTLLAWSSGLVLAART